MRKTKKEVQKSKSQLQPNRKQTQSRYDEKRSKLVQKIVRMTVAQWKESEQKMKALGFKYYNDFVLSSTLSVNKSVRDVNIKTVEIRKFVYELVKIKSNFNQLDNQLQQYREVTAGVNHSFVMLVNNTCLLLQKTVDYLVENRKNKLKIVDELLFIKDFGKKLNLIVMRNWKSEERFITIDNKKDIENFSIKLKFYYNHFIENNTHKLINNQ